MLLDGEVATGRVHCSGPGYQDRSRFGQAGHVLTWHPGDTHMQLQTSLAPYPTSGDGGAYGVVGMKIGDVVRTVAGDELVVTTLSGDVIVYNIDPPSSALVEKWRSHVHGAAGCYNSIAIENLNDGGSDEPYVAGSLGLWRFTQPDEGTPG